jgi:hypothetical protein
VDIKAASKSGIAEYVGLQNETQQPCLIVERKMQMIIGAQIGLLIYGIIAIIRGQYSMGKGRKVIGSKARMLGAVCLGPMPLSMIAGTAKGAIGVKERR